ncbi:MAG: DUF368 domain-containing protein [Chitinophagales bacterium]
MKQHILLFLKGMAMGAADIVPGVSGGTIAFITGIYEKLLNSLKSINPTLLKVLQQKGVKGAWEHINGTFLVVLFAGIGVSIITLARIISHLLATYPMLLWAFFFGLIVASAIFVGKQIKQWRIQEIVALLIGAVIAFTITVLAPVEAPTDLWFIFLAGTIAICAMILPGISGSFILLLMGLYPYITGAVKDFNLPVLVVFAAGCLAGLLSFSHVLSWMFEKFRSITLALLTGFMVGSLNKVWPWKQTLQYRTNSHGEEIPFLQKNVLPANYTDGDAFIVGVIALVILGFAVVFLLERIADSDEETI